MSRNKPYCERFKVSEVEGFQYLEYAVEDLDDEELVTYFNTAIDLDHFEHAEALKVEGIRRNLQLKYE